MRNTMCDIFLERRFGRFEVSCELLRTTSIDVLNMVFKDMVIYHAQCDDVRGVMSYYACSPHFESILENDTPKDYVVIVSRKEADLGGHLHEVSFHQLEIQDAA